MTHLPRLLLLVLSLTLLAGCPSTGVGDPCRPESVPVDENGNRGFVEEDSYVETSATQCRTRVCLVNEFEGDPTISVEECVRAGQSEPDCVQQGFLREADILQNIYCSCRCDTDSGDPNTPLCDCGDGFSCEEIVSQGSPGVQGSYCVRIDEQG